MKVRELLQLLDGIDPDTRIVVHAVDVNSTCRRFPDGTPFHVDLATVTRIGAGGTDSAVEFRAEIDLEGNLHHAA